MIGLIFTIHLQALAYAAVPLSAESVQLHQLVKQSQEQIKALKEILKYAKNDAASLDKAARMLERMNSGIDKSIEQFQGTEVYERALLDLQSKDEFKKTYIEVQNLRKFTRQPSDQQFQDLVDFQKESVRANQADLAHQKEMEQALRSAEQVFVPRLQAQAQLGDWRANTRISAQMTELLASIHAMREELRALRMRNSVSNPLAALVRGSEIQNQKVREEKSR